MAGPTSTTPTVWLKADAGAYVDAGVTLATNGQTVQQWNDQSGNGNNVSQATAGNRPTYSTSIQNSLAGILFLASSTNWMEKVFSVALSQPTTIYFVLRHRVANQQINQTYFDTNATGSQEQVVLTNSVGVYRMYAGTNQDAGSQYVGGPECAVFKAVFNGASSSLSRNGVTVISANAGTQTMPSLRLGVNPSAISAFDGYFFEILVYSGTIGATEDGQIQSYLKGRWFPSWAPSTYQMSCFTDTGTNAQPSTAFDLLTSSDGFTWTQIPVSYNPQDFFVRDPSRVKISGTYWIAHTNIVSGSTACHTFSIGKAIDGVGLYYDPVIDIDCSSITGTGTGSRAWAPEWVRNMDGTVYLDGNNLPHLIVALSSTGDPGNFQLYETHPTTTDQSLWGNSANWSALTQLTGTSLPTSMIDPCGITDGTNFYCWYKNESTTFVEVLKSTTSLTSGYTVLHSGDWMSIGSGVEGPTILKFGNGKWTVYVDRYVAGNGIGYTQQTSGAADWTGTNANAWSALTGITAPFTANHGTIIFGPTVSGLFRPCPLDGLGTGGSLFVNPLGG